MKTIDEILDLYVPCECDEAYISRRLTDPTCARCNKAIEEAMIAYATMAIEEQKKSCLKNAKMKCKRYKNDHGFYEEDWSLDPDSILNAPNVELK